MIYSSYYGNVKNLLNIGVPKENFVSISLTYPEYLGKLIGYDVTIEKTVQPFESILKEYKKGLIDWKKYCYNYYFMLSCLEEKNKNFWEEFKERNNGKVLLCWEKDVKNCHRYLLGKFLDWKFNKSKMIEVDSNLDCWKIKNKGLMEFVGNVGKKIWDEI